MNTPNPASKKAKPGQAADGAPTHIYVLLDRSGSMSSIRSDVIGGFNAFLGDQQSEGADARLTLVQFDSGDFQEIVHKHVAIDAVSPLNEHTFVPRGSTPLLDATGKLIKTARKRAKRLARDGKAEAVIFVTITDGEENASSHYDKAAIRKLIDTQKQWGWTFVYLSAGLDAYADAHRYGYDEDNIQAWDGDGKGATILFESMSVAVAHRRRDNRAGVADNATFFKGHKPAEKPRGQA